MSSTISIPQLTPQGTAIAITGGTVATLATVGSLINQVSAKRSLEGLRIGTNAVRGGLMGALAAAEVVALTRTRFSSDPWLSGAEGAAIGAAIGVGNVLAYTLLYAGLRKGIPFPTRNVVALAATAGAIIGGIAAPFGVWRTDEGVFRH